MVDHNLHNLSLEYMIQRWGCDLLHFDFGAFKFDNFNFDILFFEISICTYEFMLVTL